MQNAINQNQNAIGTYGHVGAYDTTDARYIAIAQDAHTRAFTAIDAFADRVGDYQNDTNTFHAHDTDPVRVAHRQRVLFIYQNALGDAIVAGVQPL